MVRLDEWGDRLYLGCPSKARNKMEERNQPIVLPLLLFLLISFSFHIPLFHFDGERGLSHMCVPLIHPTSKLETMCSSGVLIFNRFGTTIRFKDSNLTHHFIHCYFRRYRQMVSKLASVISPSG